MLTSALLLTLLAAALNLIDDCTGVQVQQPLFAAALTGLIFGDFKTGMECAATLQLLWLGVGPVGAYRPPDVLTGSIIGTLFAILSKQGAMAGVAVAVPVAVAVQQLDILVKTISISFMHMAEKKTEEGDFDKIDKYNWFGIPLTVLSRAVPVFLATYFGVPLIQTILNAVPKVVLDGLSIAGGIMPALGFGMLLAMMLDRKLWVFFLIGFVCNVYVKIPTLGLGLIGVALAILYDIFTGNKRDNTVVTSDEGGLDL